MDRTMNIANEVSNIIFRRTAAAEAQLAEILARCDAPRPGDVAAAVEALDVLGAARHAWTAEEFGRDCRDFCELRRRIAELATLTAAAIVTNSEHDKMMVAHGAAPFGYRDDGESAARSKLIVQLRSRSEGQARQSGAEREKIRSLMAQSPRVRKALLSANIRLPS
jgi:hypothetical protein